MVEKKFSCVKGCSDCCIYREYYPSKQFGKIGVLLLPGEVEAIEKLAQEKCVDVKILPRIAVGKGSPENMIAYQMMGKNDDGDLCPFLDTESGAQSPHGGLACRIYENRPLACRAYPLLESGDQAKLDEHCRFCKDSATSNASAQTLLSEAHALEKIKNDMHVADDSLRVWRYATATGAAQDRDKMFPQGWVIDS